MTEPAIQQPYEIVGAAKAASALGTIDAAYAKNIASSEKFDVAVQKAADRLTTAYTKRAAEAFVRNKAGLDDNTRSANSLRSSLDTLAVSTTRLAGATATQARATQAAVMSTVGMVQPTQVLATATAAQARAMQTAVVPTMTMAQQTQRLLPTFSALGASLGHIHPQLGQLSTAVGRASGALGGFGAVMGGPVGIAIAGVTVAVGLATTAYKYFKDETKDLAKASIDYNTTLEAQIELLQKAAKAASLRQQISMGVADPLVQEAEVRRIEAGMTQTRFDTRAARDAGDAGTVRKLEAKLRKQEADLKVAADNLRFNREAEAAAQADEIAEEMSPKNVRASGDSALGITRGKGKAGKAGKTEAQVDDEAIKRGQAENEAIQAEIRDRSTAAKQAREASRPVQIADRGALDMDVVSKTQMESFKHDEELKREQIALTAEMHKRAMESQMAQDAAFREAAVSTFQIMGGTGIKAMQLLAKGTKVSGKEVLASIGGELVGKGTVWLFEGIARGFSSYGLDPTATALLATGTAAIAAGMAMGAAGGNAGAMGSAHTARQKERAEEAEKRTSAVPISASRDSGAREPTPTRVTIQLNSTMPATDEDAHRIAGIMRKGMNSGRVSRAWASGG